MRFSDGAGSPTRAQFAPRLSRSLVMGPKRVNNPFGFEGAKMGSETCLDCHASGLPVCCAREAGLLRSERYSGCSAESGARDSRRSGILMCLGLPPAPRQLLNQQLSERWEVFAYEVTPSKCLSWFSIGTSDLHRDLRAKEFLRAYYLCSKGG